MRKPKISEKLQEIEKPQFCRSLLPLKGDWGMEKPRKKVGSQSGKYPIWKP